MPESFPHHESTLTALVEDIKKEVVHFVRTRVRILFEEIHQKLPSIFTALPIFGFAMVLLVTGWLLLSFAAVSYIAMMLGPNPYAWTLSLLIFGVTWIVLSLLCLIGAWQLLKPRELMPRKTIQVLKHDKVWLQKELGGRA
jgi:uncharacterized membrane protein YqjE